MKFLLVEDLEKQKYQYQGPVYNEKDSYLAERVNLTTYATSYAQAKSNFLFRLRKYYRTAAYIDSTLIKKVNTQKSNNQQSQEKKLDKDKIVDAEQISMFD